MNTSLVNKWGNSLGIGIPQTVAVEVGLAVGTV
jgi:antitoxin component of MazEF toxin-antitoxin module